MANSELITESYSDTCKTHGEFTSEAIRLPFSEKPIRKGCPTCLAERESARKAEEAREADRHDSERVSIDLKRRRDSGVPLRFEGKTLEGYQINSDKQQLAVATCQSLIDAIQQGRDAPNLIFLGKPGTGKSHLACAIVSALYKSHRVCRIDLPDLIREIRATWGRSAKKSEAEVLDHYGALDLLILEEVGTGAGSDDERARVFQVINRRYEAMLPTVVVSNLDMPALRAEMGDRVIDRLREGDRALVAFDWESMRGAA